VQLAARARAAGLAINPRMVFENPTVQQLAAALDALGEDADLIEQVPAPADASFEPMSTSGLSAADLAAVTRLWSTSRDGAS
jgi:mycobactin peptide synthetase MbtE